MSEITIQGISKTFGDTRVLNDISFCAKDGNLLSLLGPSGCGKTTLLRIIAGLEYADSGTIHVGERDLTPIPVEKRNIGVVFQNYALIPHMTVFNNIAYGLKIRKVPKEQIREKVEQYIRLVGLTGMTDRKVTQLSGGQQQRVALARALIIEPDILLLDEPLSALDRKIRAEMQYEIRNLQRQIGTTTVFVTHDQEEALSMSDTVVVMSEGRIQQIGTPIDIYNEPQNAFVADFIGESNILDGVMLADYKVNFSGHTFDCVDAGFEKRENVDVVIRPEDVDIVSEEKGMLKGVVTSVTFLGVHYEIIVDIGGIKWMIQTTDFVDVDEHIGLYIEPDAIHIMKKSEYSGMYGDYSSFSNEFDELSDAESEIEE